VAIQASENYRDLSLRQMKNGDIPAVIQIHQQSFTGFFLTILGPAFLTELYKATLIDPSGISFVVECQSKISGFVVGTEQPAGFYKRLISQRWWRFALASIWPLVSCPTILPRLLRAFSSPATVTQIAKRGTLMSIAVLPNTQGRGIGKTLVQAFLQEAVHRGLHQVDLTTDRDHNEIADHFYQKLGFVCMRSFTTPEGRIMNEYVIDLHLTEDGTDSNRHVSILPQGEYIA
jgi:ribosomal protein S18 acetylase RimI-like enzyme